MSSTDQFLLSYLILVNLAAFIAFYRDKQKAVRREYRTPELELLLFSLAGGPFGSLLAMKRFRHKTRHAKFRILVPLACLVWGSATAYVVINGLPR